MKIANQVIAEFYQLTGKLFYAVAKIDHTIREKEILKLREIVEKEWLHLDNSLDEFGTDAAYQIEIVFDWLKENNWEIGPVLAELKHFKNDHPKLFTPEIIDLIIRTANIIAEAYAGQNHLEEYFVKDIERVLLN